MSTTAGRTRSTTGAKPSASVAAVGDGAADGGAGAEELAAEVVELTILVVVAVLEV